MGLVASALAAPDPRLIRLESIERRLTDGLTELRVLRREIEAEGRDRGALGSRGLTGFILGTIQQYPERTFHVRDLLDIAEAAGYSIPTARTLSKRLTERRIRVGDIAVTRDDRWKAVREES